MSVSGTIEDWRESIGKLASGNSRLIFAISAAFAPALAKIAGEDSGGFHFRGASWRSTANGLEGLAALHNDGLLILDELSQLDPKEAGEAAYWLMVKEKHALLVKEQSNHHLAGHCSFSLPERSL